MKPYLKVGKWGAKEKQMVTEIEAAIAKKKLEDPEFDFNPADDFEDLKKLHRELTSEYVEFTEHKDTDKTMSDSKKDDEFTLTNDKKVDLSNTKTTVDEEFKDPFNEAAPIIRDYVKEDKFHQEDPNNPTRTNFEEPANFNDAYSIPGADEDEQIKQGGIGNESKGATKGSKAPKADPVNPSFNDMEKPSKNKQTKRFAKRIVGAVTMLLEKGFVWWTTKNINDAKLTEYELNGEIDLTLLISLEGGVQATVRDFFAGQCKLAEQAAKISKDDQDELAEALADVLMEKGITPTPTQVLMMSALEIVGRQAITAFAMSSQTNAVLAQLRAIKNGEDVEHEEQSGGQQYQHTNHGQNVDHTTTVPVDENTELEEEENSVMNEQQAGSEKVEIEEVPSTELVKTGE